MSSTKRKAIDTGLQRRVRARREESEEVANFDSESDIQEQDDEGSSESSDDKEDDDEKVFPLPLSF
jgi:ribosomal RNA-processing protein 36